MTMVMIDDETGDSFYIGDAEIAFVAYDPIDDTWHTGAKSVGLDIIKQMLPNKKTCIGQLEAMAADAFVHTLPADRLHNRKAFMWIDNLSAVYSLRKGDSKVGDTGKVVNSFHVMQTKRQLRMWFEYVPSEQNIADLPSRRKWCELHRVIDSVSGGSRTCFRYDVVIPPYDSWLSPLLGHSSAKRRRHSSRGAKRAGRARVV